MKQFKLPNNFPKPRKSSVILRQITQGTLTTDAGIILAEPSANNVQKPNVGMVYATGDNVPDDVKPGMKVYYNQYANLEILISGVPYILMHEQDVYCELPDDSRVMPQYKTEKEVRLEKKIPEQDNRFKRQNTHKSNEQDKKHEIIKKSIKKSPKKK